MKVALFAFNGDPVCFVHVLLHALDMKENGYDAHIVVEGAATKLVKEFHDNPSAPFASLYTKVKEAGLIGCVCKACATKMGSLDSAEAQGFSICEEMSGHPSITRFIKEGYQVFTF